MLGALLGTGGMGKVHAAHDKKLAREVAIKLLSAASPEPESLRRFQREALATGSLQHPNVVAVFDVGDEEGRPFIVTELLRGTTLREKLRAGPLPLAETLRIARQVAAGLAAAHAKGLTHRDLKPENIFITEEGFAKILDFGLVKLAEDLATRPGSEPVTPDEARTGAGRMLGTVGYMAPEQVRGRPVDPRADLFNFGAVLYEMLSGRRPFQGGSPTEIGYATLFKKPAPLPAEVPRPLRELIDRCLEKDREQRGTAREVVAALESVSPAPARRRLRVPAQVFMGVGAAIAIASLLVAGLRIWRNPHPPKHAAAPQAGTVAILPFGARDAPKFAWLSEGVVDLLARDLKGTDLRVVDSASVLRALGGDVSNDVDKVRGASAQLGAKYFVLGRIEERDGALVLEAVLHAGDAGTPVSEAVAQGDPAQVLRLVRQLSDQLQQRPLPKPEFDTRLNRLARETSGSPQALQAWIEGENFLRRSRWEEGRAALQRAATLDPEFALAQYRLASASGIAEPGLAEDALVRALRNEDRLNPAERLLVRGRLAAQQGMFSESERILLDASRRFPDDPETWMELGELYFHSSPLRALSPQQSAAAFQQILVLDPFNAEAINHLADLAQMRGERGLVARLTDRLLAVSGDAEFGLSLGLTRAWARSDSKEHDNVLAELRQPGLSRALLKTAFVRAEWQLDGFADAQAIAEVIAGGASEGDQSYGHYLLGALQLLRGRPDAARVEMTRAISLSQSSDAVWVLPWIDTLDFVNSSPEQLAAARTAAERLEAIRPPAQLLPMARYLIGALAARQGDVVAAEKAAVDLEHSPPLDGSSIDADLALAVRARILARRNDSAGALALLQQQQLRVSARYSIYTRVAEPDLRAQLLEALARPREALGLADALVFYSTLAPVTVPAAHLRTARLLEMLGDAQGALDHYMRFVELWKNCESSEQPMVDRAKARIEQLKTATTHASR